MDETLDERIDNLRKRSRLLLAKANKHSKKVKKEIKKLHSQNSTQRENYENHATHDETFRYREASKSWKLRNDSSGVDALLHPDYIYHSSNHMLARMPNISTSKRVLITSKKHCEEQCSKTIPRKPVKECYCHPHTKKVQLRSPRTQYKQHLPCKCCKTHVDIRLPFAKYNDEKPALTSPISCETLRRVQKIDYAPRSQFLRNVQSKVSVLHTAATGDCPDTCTRSPRYHEFMTRKNLQSTDRTDKMESQTTTRVTKSRSLPVTSTHSGTIEEEQSFVSDNVAKSSKGVQVSLKKQSRPKLVTKRTISSKKSVPDLKKTKSNSKTSVKSKRASHLFNKECPCCHKNKVVPSKVTVEKDNIDSEDYQHTVCVNDGREESDEEYLSDDEVKELRKFREQNYFDTHGSRHTLLSSKSSGSLEQYLLNDRLFPEPAKRIHKKDLVVTMPACATLQRKRMHYFPRYIVHQEKNVQNANKKKRCQSCPLTGHAIDLGITKMRPPLNSLALKYQKRIP
ncbi:uncharacterized protein LOC128880103 [Hylaeus volcanicus]|uniref:uncharacterized protein LOC128880103 n=1 Tax=Hylaeus volcanicus TaxID=313075 RepID=UPI0023B87C9F|nr:uncharacterized protein LOC128880103 [Hylaeus volcanicus]XP_053985788.1 uncharacterized protein LOC128880103 [Hylaeus volcanicus]